MTLPTPQRMAETLRLVLGSHSAGLHTALPGIVRRYDHAAQTVDVQPALRTVLPATDEDEADVSETLPEILSVPVAWPRGGGFALHFPLVPGDTVLLVFCEADAGPWRGSGEVSDPGTPERHGLSGAVAIPGYSARADTIDGASSEHARAGVQGGAYVEFRPGEILAGGSDPVAMAAKVNAEFEKIGKTLDSLTGGSGSAAAFTTPYIQGDVDSDVLKGS